MVFAVSHGSNYIAMFCLIAGTSIHCEFAASPVHGSVVVQGNAAGSTVATYSCHANYHLLGDHLRACDDSRGWSGEEPVCKCQSLALLWLNYGVIVELFLYIFWYHEEMHEYIHTYIKTNNRYL